MNKYLAEQLLEFNKQHPDQYNDNWGTILKFVHKDPNQPGYQLNRNNSGVDIFQKQMRKQEEELLAKLARKKEEHKKARDFDQKSATELNQRYLKDKGKQINALIKEVNEEPGSAIQATMEANATQFQASSDTGLPLTTDPNITFDKSLKGVECTSLQQVSFQVDMTPTNTVKPPAVFQADCHSSSLNNRYEKNPKVSSLTPNILGSEVLEKINSHIDEMDVKDSRNRSNDANLVKKGAQ